MALIRASTARLKTRTGGSAIDTIVETYAHNRYMMGLLSSLMDKAHENLVRSTANERHLLGGPLLPLSEML